MLFNINSFSYKNYFLKKNGREANCHDIMTSIVICRVHPHVANYRCSLHKPQSCGLNVLRLSARVIRLTYILSKSSRNYIE